MDLHICRDMCSDRCAHQCELPLLCRLAPTTDPGVSPQTPCGFGTSSRVQGPASCVPVPEGLPWGGHRQGLWIVGSSLGEVDEHRPRCSVSSSGGQI